MDESDPRLVVVDIGIPMCAYADRLNTFSMWKHGTSSAEKMAEAGFYFCGKRGSDTVRCFLCAKELDCWEPDDDPWYEHKSHSSSCVYAQFGKLEADLSFHQLVDLCEFYALKQVDKEEATKIAEVEKFMKNAIKKLKKYVSS